MLDSPDYFWEEDEFEPLYSKMMRYLDVAHRVTVLNTRLDVLRELYVYKQLFTIIFLKYV